MTFYKLTLSRYRRDDFIISIVSSPLKFYYYFIFMIIGIPREIKSNENRVALTPSGAEILKNHGHSVIVENNAGVGSGFKNEEYVAAGAEIIATAKEVFDRAEMIMKVKE